VEASLLRFLPLEVRLLERLRNKSNPNKEHPLILRRDVIG